MKEFRGYQKIKEANEFFRYDFRGKAVLDIGASTGGFTKYALDNGAAFVYAVEKGTAQMTDALRYDMRVEVWEKTDIFEVAVDGMDCRAIVIEEERRDGEKRIIMSLPTVDTIKQPDVILVDVSFISLTKILKYATMKLCREKTDFLVMLKPQFEAAPKQLNRGVVKNESMRRDIIRQFENWLRENGFVIVAKRDNELTGKKGNRERFYYLTWSRS
ncbi:hypothetical protein IJG22_01050 [Candidatus Saccharibacteria bacterium]|nr:hypothetical protein [Candidatus Saccharibacteria bacterium]